MRIDQSDQHNRADKLVAVPSKTQQDAAGEEGQGKGHERQEPPGKLGDEQSLAAEPDRNRPDADAEASEHGQEDEE